MLVPRGLEEKEQAQKGRRQWSGREEGGLPAPPRRPREQSISERVMVVTKIKAAGQPSLRGGAESTASEAKNSDPGP